MECVTVKRKRFASALLGIWLVFSFLTFTTSHFVHEAEHQVFGDSHAHAELVLSDQIEAPEPVTTDAGGDVMSESPGHSHGSVPGNLLASLVDNHGVAQLFASKATLGFQGDVDLKDYLQQALERPPKQLS